MTLNLNYHTLIMLLHILINQYFNIVKNNISILKYQNIKKFQNVIFCVFYSNILKYQVFILSKNLLQLTRQFISIFFFLYFQ